MSLEIFNGLEISLSEVNKVLPDLTIKQCLDENFKNDLNQLLYNLGMDTNQPIDKEVILHRNRFNEVVNTLRFSGYERTDLQWLNSGYASQVTKDKAKNSKMLTDLYFQHSGLVESR